MLLLEVNLIQCQIQTEDVFQNSLIILVLDFVTSIDNFTETEFIILNVSLDENIGGHIVRSPLKPFSFKKCISKVPQFSTFRSHSGCQKH